LEENESGVKNRLSSNGGGGGGGASNYYYSHHNQEAKLNNCNGKSTVIDNEMQNLIEVDYAERGGDDGDIINSENLSSSNSNERNALNTASGERTFIYESNTNANNALPTSSSSLITNNRRSKKASRCVTTIGGNTSSSLSSTATSTTTFSAAAEFMRARNLNKRYSLQIYPNKLSVHSIKALNRAGRIKNLGEYGKPIIIGPKSPIRHLICSPGLELKEYKANIVLMYKGSCGNNCAERKEWTQKNHMHYIVNTVNCRDHISRLVAKLGFEFFSSFVLQTSERQMQVVAMYNMQKV
jgi:hypothetical protein